MPAVAIAPLEHEDEAQSAPASPAAAVAAPSPQPNTPDNNMEWRHVATYADRFTGSEEAVKAHPRRRKPRHHKRFVVSGVTLAAGLVFLELMGLVWLRALDLKAMRQDSELDKSISLSNESIARTQKKIAALNSSPHLSRWAAELGYRPAAMSDFDDVTKNEPMAVPETGTPEEVR